MEGGNMRGLVLKLARGVEKEKFEHCRLMLKSFEGELSKLQLENRRLKTEVKDLKARRRHMDWKGTVMSEDTI